MKTFGHPLLHPTQNRHQSLDRSSSVDWDGLCCCSAGPSLLVLSHHGSHVIFGKSFASLGPSWGSFLIFFFPWSPVKETKQIPSAWLRMTSAVDECCRGEGGDIDWVRNMHVCFYIYIDVLHMFMYIYAYVLCVCVYIYTYACMYMCICIYTYIYLCIYR